MSNNHEDVPDELILAALDRAVRHRAKDHKEVPVWDIHAHLEIPRRSWRARKVRARLIAMEEAGVLVRTRRHGLEMWMLTDTGRRRVTRIIRAGGALELPEAPQHRQWRNARALAGQEIERFRASVGDALSLASGMLAATPAAGSDDWFEMGEYLRFECRRLGSATYCLSECKEPDDSRPDLDDNSGRRHIPVKDFRS